MDCDLFVQRLDALLAGTLGAEARRALAAHRGGCERCGRLWLAVQEEAAEAPAAGNAFVSTVLERTSGAPCGRAQELLPAWVDGTLAADDAHLIGMHLLHCSSCAALTATLAALRLELPTLAETEPGPEFTRSVLASTQGLRRRPAARWLETWQHLVLRPRFALEFATAACVLLMLLCALPFSPFRPLPQQALAFIRLDGGGLVAAASSRLGPALQSTASRAWEGSAGRIEKALAAKGRAFTGENATTAAAWEAVRADLAEAQAGIETRNFPRFSQALHDLGGDLRRLWRDAPVPAGAPEAATPEEPR